MQPGNGLTPGTAGECTDSSGIPQSMQMMEGAVQTRMHRVTLENSFLCPFEAAGRSLPDPDTITPALFPVCAELRPIAATLGSTMASPIGHPGISGFKQMEPGRCKDFTCGPGIGVCVCGSGALQPLRFHFLLIIDRPMGTGPDTSCSPCGSPGSFSLPPSLLLPFLAICPLSHKTRLTHRHTHFLSHFLQHTHTLVRTHILVTRLAYTKTLLSREQEARAGVSQKFIVKAAGKKKLLVVYYHSQKQRSSYSRATFCSILKMHY